MLKNVRKSRILLSIAIIALIFILLGNVYSLATEGNTVTITATTENTTAGNNITANTNTPSNITSIVSSGDNTTSTYDNANTTSNSSSLPHTGADSKTLLFIVAFAISAVYAYKKVNDYNF